MKFSFYCEMYRVTIYVYFGAVDENLHKFMQPIAAKYGYVKEEYQEFCRKNAGVMSRYGSNFFIWMPAPPTTASQYGDIAHEISHVVNGIFNIRGIEPDSENNEPFAYLTGWITQKIFGKILKKEKSAA